MQLCVQAALDVLDVVSHSIFTKCAFMVPALHCATYHQKWLNSAASIAKCSDRFYPILFRGQRIEFHSTVVHHFARTMLLLEPLIEFLFITIGYLFGFLPVLVGTLGSVEPEPLERLDDYRLYRSKGMKWWHITYRDDDKRYLPASSVALVGWILIAGVAGWLWLIFKAIGF